MNNNNQKLWLCGMFRGQREILEKSIYDVRCCRWLAARL